MAILDDQNVITQKDPQGALVVGLNEAEQLRFDALLRNKPGNVWRPDNIILAGMGGSALAGGMVKDWLELPLPFEVVRRYALPTYANEKTLVIASSYSGNTEETVSALHQAEERGCRIAVIASGGKLIEIAQDRGYTFVQLEGGLQPRMAVLMNLRALTHILEAFSLVKGAYDQLAANVEWLEDKSKQWAPTVATEQNEAKQLALEIAGKTPVIYAGSKLSSIAYKWKISFNENAKNVAFCNEIPEFNHNEFMGWTSHPVDKPFAVIDLVSRLEHERIQKRFVLSDRMLSGMRPKSLQIPVQGETLLQQMLWGSVLADMVSIYVAILNGVNPTPVDIIERFKKELES